MSTLLNQPKKLPAIVFCFYCLLSLPVKGQQPAVKSSTPNDSLTWIDNFKVLRTAIYQNNLAVVKQYFSFPVLNSNNEIWQFILPEEALTKKKFAGDKIVPFYEKDLVLYFNKIFPKPLIKSMLKIKSDELYKKGYAETAEQYDDSTTTYRLYATYEKKTGLLSLNLAYNQIIKDEKGTILDSGESNVIYYFTVQKNGRLLFKEIRLAG